MRVVTIFVFLILGLGIFAQNTDEKLAAQFYEDEEYDKAESIYKKLYRENSSSIYIYENYLNTLIKLKDQKGAEKLVEKHIKKYPDRLISKIDLGHVYLQFDEKDKADKYFKNLFGKYVNDKNSVVMLAQGLQRRQLFGRATSLYEMASQKQGVLAFYPQLMAGYRRDSENEKLVDVGLEVVKKDPSTVDYVLRSFDRVYEEEETSTYLQRQTLLYAQKNSNTQVFDEMLLEIFIQLKKYKSALRQVIALNKRNNLEGGRVLGMAKLGLDNKKYDIAISAYNYVIELGEGSKNLLVAEEGLINALYLKTTSGVKTEKEEIASLIEKIKVFVDENGKDYRTANSLYRLAELQIFYNNNLGAGINILDGIINTPRIQSSFLADSKLLLGDAYLMQNNIWDAKLMYGQVYKQFKEDAKGQEAKFKNAKLSYYTGDFEWAKSQLDILKTATSQLISNNALELALLIQDNTGLDSTDEAMKEYALADFYLYQNNISKCTEMLNLLPFKYPNHSLSDEIFFLKARVKEKQGDYTEANKLYTSIYTKYSDDILADNALYRSAMITLQVLGDKETAQSLFEKLVLDYNSSLFVVDARKIYYGLKEGKSEELDIEEAFFKGLNFQG